MSGRIYQNVVLQLRETSGQTVGVIDADGTVVSCSDLSTIGAKWPHYVPLINAANGQCVSLDGKVFKALSSWGTQMDSAVFVIGDGEISRTICTMSAVALNTAKSSYESKYDRTFFIKNIISDNILLSDVYSRAKELHIATDVNRIVYVAHMIRDTSFQPLEVVSNMFADNGNNFAVNIADGDIALVYQLGDTAAPKEINKVAQQLRDALKQGDEPAAVVGIGTVAAHIRDLARSYKEAQIAIEVGRVFDTEEAIINYDNLGIGRLIYQLPTTLCEMFLYEVFKKTPIESLDDETLETIYRFFENNLNVSETSRKLFVHRNTLVYRLEKIKKLTGLDLREFDDAITFKVAIMVRKYLNSRGVTLEMRR